MYNYCKDKMKEILFEEKIMLQAIELARKGNGKVAPNPRVGAIIVKNGEIISEGWHHEFGAKHAEVDAVENAQGIDLEGAEMYVNLEPCVHTGKTPPCTTMLIEKKFSKIVIGLKDPNPIVSGKGIQILKDSGIEVVTDVCIEEATWVNRFFIKHIKTGIPYVILKVAQSINGSIATTYGQSQWITCPTSRICSHKLRSVVDGVIIGNKTAMTDDPSLTVRAVEGVNPKRIIFDTNLTTPLSIKLFQDSFRENTIICCNNEASKIRKAETLRLVGVNVLPIMKKDENNFLDIESTLLSLSNKHSISSVMVEGGSSIFSSFMKTNFVDEMHIFIAPMIIGNGLNAFGHFTTNSLNNANRFSLKEHSRYDDDLHIVLYNK